MSKKNKSSDMKLAKEKFESGTIKVRIIQAHVETVEMPAQAAPEASPRRDGSGYIRRRVGDEIEIDVAQFCDNVHEKISDKPANGQI